MGRAVLVLSIAVLSTFGVCLRPAGAGAGVAWPVAGREALIVTSGSIDGDQALRLRAPTIRATVGRVPRAGIEMRFVYRGPTAKIVPLASGEIRRQIGLKLRAQDGCNVVYVMWHIDPQPGLHVSVKSNPGGGDSGCGDRGYQSVGPTWSRSDLAAIVTGQERTLAARIVGAELQVEVDGALAWRGTLPPRAFAFDGPVGLRSDNGVFDLTLRVPAVAP